MNESWLTDMIELVKQSGATGGIIRLSGDQFGAYMHLTGGDARYGQFTVESGRPDGHGPLIIHAPA